MASRGSGNAVGVVAIIVLVILGILIRYAKEIGIVAGCALALWVFYKMVSHFVRDGPPSASDATPSTYGEQPVVRVAVEAPELIERALRAVQGQHRL